MNTLLTLQIIRHRRLYVCFQMWTKIGYRSTSAINRKAIYTQRQLVKRQKKYIMYKGIRNAITKE